LAGWSAPEIEIIKIINFTQLSKLRFEKKRIDFVLPSKLRFEKKGLASPILQSSALKKKDWLRPSFKAPL
jgi:hypothetical protein